MVKSEAAIFSYESLSEKCGIQVKGDSMRKRLSTQKTEETKA
jgi:hypothetical protein